MVDNLNAFLGRGEKFISKISPTMVDNLNAFFRQMRGVYLKNFPTMDNLNSFLGRRENFI